MTTAYQCPTCLDVTEDGVCLCGPPAPTVARVPLRASLIAWCRRQAPAWEAEGLRLMKIAQQERAWAEQSTGVQREVAILTAGQTEKRAAMLYESACRWSD